VWWVTAAAAGPAQRSYLWARQLLNGLKVRRDAPSGTAAASPARRAFSRRTCIMKLAYRSLRGFALAAAAAGALCGALPAAQAEDKDDKILSLGTGRPSGKQLTREQLRDCLELQPQLKIQGDEAVRGRADLAAAKSEFDQLEAQLQKERTQVDASDKAEVDAYNAKVGRRQQMIADYNAKLPVVNEQARNYNALQQNWKSQCEDRPYRESDYNAVQRGR
jgi:hypothetical protein